MNEQAIQFLRERDPELRSVIDRIGPIVWKPTRDSIFESLVDAITSQQLSGKAAATIFGRVKALYPGRAFPTAQQLASTAHEVLRAAGLSNNKVKFIHDLARHAAEGYIPSPARLRAMSDAEIVAHLTEIHGIGRWTVEMLLIFKLGRLDVLPVHDLGVQKGFAKVYRKRKLPTPKQLEAFGERWRPHRTTAARYLWKSLTLP